jgi:hypothetical protein
VTVAHCTIDPRSHIGKRKFDIDIAIVRTTIGPPLHLALEVRPGMKGSKERLMRLIRLSDERDPTDPVNVLAQCTSSTRLSDHQSNPRLAYAVAVIGASAIKLCRLDLAVFGN